MDLETQLLTNNSKANASHIAGYIGNDPERFRDLMTVLFEGPGPVTQRAAWAASLTVADHPELATPYLGKLIRHLGTPGLHPAVKRNGMKILEAAAIPAEIRGEAIDLCFLFLSGKKQPVAVQVLAMIVLFPLIEKEPDLKKELRICVEDQMPYATAAFKSRGKKLLGKLK